MHPTDTPVKKMLRISEAMALQISRYRHRREIASETEAMRRLLAFALEHDRPQRPPPASRRTGSAA